MFKRMYDCEKLMEYLYSKSNEEIENDLKLDPLALHSQSIRNWKLLDRQIDEDKLNKLNEYNLADIAILPDTDPLYIKVNTGTSTPNAKRIFNMMMCEQEDFNLTFNDENSNSPLIIYMTEILGVKAPQKRKSISYLPGRSITLEMLCNAGNTYNYSKKGIIHDLKSLISLEIIEAFELYKKNEQYDIAKISKEAINNTTFDMYDNWLYKLSLDGCINYIKK